MADVPSTKLAKVQYYTAHLAPWQANAAAIGLVAADVTSLTAKTTAAMAAFDAQRAAMQAAKAATEAFYNAVEAVGVQGAAMIKMIRAKAEATGNANVYVLAQIPSPAVPTPKGPPGTPYKFKATLNGDGSVDLGWSCDNPAAGTIYQVFRSLTGLPNDYVYIGGTGQRKFEDATIPAGTSYLSYKIQGVRSSAAGQWATFVVGFGSGVVPPTAGAETVVPVRRAA